MLTQATGTGQPLLETLDGAEVTPSLAALDDERARIWPYVIMADLFATHTPVLCSSCQEDNF